MAKLTKTLTPVYPPPRGIIQTSVKPAQINPKALILDS